MSLLSKAFVIGLLAGILGLILSLAPGGLAIEESLGLSLLFRLRGEREVPSDVCIVTMDKDSSDYFNLPAEPEKWPRSMHGRLIDNLANEGVSLIAFDIVFDEAHSAEEDNLFAEAINRAGNVILGEYIRKDIVPLSGGEGSHGAEVNIEKLVPPIDLFLQAAVAVAPFPLPKVPVRVNQYWTFKTSAGDTPTLPVVAYQIFALQVYDDFIQLADKSSSSLAAILPQNKNEFIQRKRADKFVREVRDRFQKNPAIAESMLQELKNLPMNDSQKLILKSLLKMYQSPDSRYLNFYGPPGTIPTVSYHQLMQIQPPLVVKNKHLEFQDKAIFIGLSEQMRPEQKDGFHTTFSQSTGVDISGVEIAATAFANLLEDMPIQPISLLAHVTLILLWGLLLGIVSKFLPALFSALTLIGVSILYVLFARYQFTYAGIWYPVIFPVCFQAPFAFFVAVLWKYFDTHRERQNIREAFGYYLPEKVVDQLAKNVAEVQSGAKLVFGTCLCTDAEKYSALSETMDPNELRNFLNKYYEALFEPVRSHGGIVSDVIGDSMMALWTTAHPDTTVRSQACVAALEISRSVHQFNLASNRLQLPTRIGVHSGHMALGSVGAIDHYEYRAVGDIVNTVSRIEGLNKKLGTSILVSAEVLDQLDDFLTRELGQFLLSGKSRSVVVHELICRMEEATEQQRSLCATFTEALGAYQKQSWARAIDKFNQLLQISHQDGPSHFYLKLCEEYKKNPPGANWDGIVRF